MVVVELVYSSVRCGNTSGGYGSSGVGGSTIRVEVEAGRGEAVEETARKPPPPTRSLLADH